MDLGAFRHIDMEQLFADQFCFVDGQIGWRCQFLGIVNGSDEILTNLFERIRCDSLDCSIVLDTKQ